MSVDTPTRLFTGATPPPQHGGGERKLSPGSTPRGQKLADWQASSSTPKQATPRSGKRKNGSGIRRDGRGSAGRRRNNKGSGLKLSQNISVVSDSDSSLSDSDDSDSDEEDAQGDKFGISQEKNYDDTTSPLQSADDVTAAMRRSQRYRQQMKFGADWEDVYLADQLRAAERERHPELDDDGLPPDWVVFLGIIIVAILLGLMTHFLLKHNGYHDLEHEDIRDLEL